MIYIEENKMNKKLFLKVFPKHLAVWEYVIDKIKKGETDIPDIKEESFKALGYKNVLNNCFACHYADTPNKSPLTCSEHCFFDVKNKSPIECLDGLFYKLENSLDGGYCLEESVKLAGQVRDFPLKEEFNFIYDKQQK